MIVTEIHVLCDVVEGPPDECLAMFTSYSNNVEETRAEARNAGWNIEQEQQLCPAHAALRAEAV